MENQKGYNKWILNERRISPWRKGDKSSSDLSASEKEEYIARLDIFDVGGERSRAFFQCRTEPLFVPPLDRGRAVSIIVFDTYHSLLKILTLPYNRASVYWEQ